MRAQNGMSDHGEDPALARALQRPLVLASASPRRAELLRQVGLSFEAQVSNVPEEGDGAGRDATEVAAEHARQKALVVARQCPERLVLGADTVVVLDGAVLGKPVDATAAQAMLRRLSGREHEVITAVTLALSDGRCARVLDEHAECTRVRFRALSPTEIECYVATGEPLDKAGGYGIQGRGALLVRAIEGCYFNVVGLPLSSIWEMLARLGRPVGDMTSGGVSRRRAAGTS